MNNYKSSNSVKLAEAVYCELFFVGNSIPKP